MKSFNEFDIKPNKKGFTGDKIKMSRILNVSIIIHAFKMEPSQFGGERVDMQIEKDKTLYVIWSSSKTLIEMIRKVPEDGFPFTTIIIKKDERFVFS